MICAAWMPPLAINNNSLRRLRQKLRELPCFTARMQPPVSPRSPARERRNTDSAPVQIPKPLIQQEMMRGKMRAQGAAITADDPKPVSRTRQAPPQACW